MGPINVLMVFLIATPSPIWMKISAAAVVGLTLYALMRGYLTRLTIEPAGVCLRRGARTILLKWSDIQAIDEYAPTGGVGGVTYVYVTTRDRPPAGRWEIDDTTIQVQARPGLLEALRAARAEHASNMQ